MLNYVSVFFHALWVGGCEGVGEREEKERGKKEE